MKEEPVSTPFHELTVESLIHSTAVEYVQLPVVEWLILLSDGSLLTSVFSRSDVSIHVDQY